MNSDDEGVGLPYDIKCKVEYEKKEEGKRNFKVIIEYLHEAVGHIDGYEFKKNRKTYVGFTDLDLNSKILEGMRKTFAKKRADEPEAYIFLKVGGRFRDACAFIAPCDTKYSRYLEHVGYVEKKTKPNKVPYYYLSNEVDPKKITLELERGPFPHYEIRVCYNGIWTGNIDGSVYKRG